MLAYLGYNHYVAVYEVRGQAMAFELGSRRIFPVSDFRAFPPVPEQFGPSSEPQFLLRREQVNTKSAYKDLPVPMQDQGDSQIPGYMDDNCGPTSGAMVAEYYDQYRGYHQFDAWFDDHNQLYDYMETNNWGGPGTAPWNAGGGWTSYASSKGYDFISYTGAEYPDWWTIMQYRIDKQQPFLVMFWWGAPYAQWHYCTIRGYFGTSSTKFAIINNPAGGFRDYVNIDANEGQITLIELWPSGSG
jgi:hypothetical protein